MSRSHANRAELLEALGNDLCQRVSMTMLSYIQAVAEQVGLNVTDLKLLNQARCAVASPVGELASEPVAFTAGQLAESTGLSTGAVTGVIDRLEKAGLVRRVRGGDDRRKVLVVPDPDRMADIDALFDPFSEALTDILNRYSNAELELLQGFVNDLSDEMASRAAAIRAGRSERRAATL